MRRIQRNYLRDLYYAWVDNQALSYWGKWDLKNGSKLAEQLGISGAAYSKIKNGSQTEITLLTEGGYNASIL